MMPIIVETTCKDKKEAKEIAKILVDTELSACVQIKRIESVFRWEGKVCEEKEYKLSIKTKKDNFKKIKRIIKENHSYDLPEITAVSIVGTSKQYLKYLEENII